MIELSIRCDGCRIVGGANRKGHQVREVLKREGWAVSTPGGRDYCPGCQVVDHTHVKAGQMLIDDYRQLCKVVSVRTFEIETRRRDERGWWDCTAKWTPAQFDAKRFRFSKYEIGRFFGHRR